ncbi:histidine utilization repressor [Curvivirga aplysinae]|uniref:histidine utilization repressor n=1 Tax=Curvivirga aplysinae TaxID=2529852 RepID=UPI0012BB8131|nr:histidine utilization repressor [Curvivirga aplysinae]MTI09566.1 histidine utilization repressor [Curvivirga aplysinae]
MTDQPRYKQIKDHIIHHIRSGEWPADSQIPSENELLKELGVSRMTVNRAVRELTAEGVLRRVQGLGTFVAGPQPASVLLELRNIADDIRERGNTHSTEIIMKETIQASKDQAQTFYISEGDELFHTILLHKENDLPLQLEDRLVNPKTAPDYLECDFTETTPNAYLVATNPADEVEHLVEAQLPSTETSSHLQMKNGEPCLLLNRRTWSSGQVVSVAKLYHPGNRYSLGAHFHSRKEAVDF